MILTCPACGTQYAVKDGAIPPQGRQVRCASCKHSWHQDPDAPVAVPAPLPPVEEPVGDFDAPETAYAEAEPAPPPETVAATDEYQAEPYETPASPEPEFREAAYAEPTEEWVPPPRDESFRSPADDFDTWSEAREIEERPGRKGLLILLLLVLLIAALAIGAWFFAPREWMARVGLREAAADSPLQLMVTSQDRQKLASGNDLVSLSGRVINPTDETLTVPPLQADLRDGGGKLVYSWTIAPPARRLAPRASASFNAAELGVPPQATSLTLRWAG